MDFLKQHLFFIVCGVVGVGGIALGITGWRAMPRVLAAMEEAEALHRNLKGLRNNPVNLEAVEAEQRRVDRELADHAKVLDKAKELYDYKPLVEGVFPDGNAQARYEFQEAYAKAMQGLMKSLEWGGPPTASEIDYMQERIEQEEFERKLAGTDAEASEDLSLYEGPARTAAGVPTAAGIRTNAAARAAIMRARNILCYAVDFGSERRTGQAPSLDFHPYMRISGEFEAPQLRDIWDAQVGYWIQKDVVEAIVALNNEAADELEREDRWVGTMPVKDVISIRLTFTPVPPMGEGEEFYGKAPGGYDPAIPPGFAEMAFTHNGSCPAYDVWQFSVKLVMDQRDIPRLIERICANRFHTLLRVAYKAVPVNRKLEGKVYGSEPAVNVVMDFETILLNDVFGPLKPEVVDEE